MARRAKSKDKVLWCTLQVGSLNYKVYLADRTKHKDLEDNVGVCDAEKCQIFIAWDIDPSLAENTLWHEISHAIVFTSGIVIEKEEEVINPLTSAQYDVLKRNGLLKLPPRPAIPLPEKNEPKEAA